MLHRNAPSLPEGTTRTRHAKPIGLVLTTVLLAGTGLAVLAPTGAFAEAAPVRAGQLHGWSAQGVFEVPVAAQTDVSAVSVADEHVLALKADGSVVGRGSDSDGQSTVPQSASTGATAVATDYRYSMVLKSDGSVVAWGWNMARLTAVPEAAQHGVTDIAANGWSAFAVTSTGSVVAWGFDIGNVTEVPEAATSGVVQVRAGLGFAIARKSDGTVIGWGDQASAALSIPDAAKNGVTDISAGDDHALALKSDGSVIAWGTNDRGQSTVPEAAKTGVTAIAAGYQYSLALKSDGTLISWGSPDSGLSGVPDAAKSGVIAMAAGNGSAFAVTRASAPVVTRQPGSVVVASGSTVQFSAAASGDPTPTVQWQKAPTGSGTFTAIPGATSTTFTTPSLFSGDDGSRYRAVFSNSVGQVVSDAATAHVPATIPSVTAPNGAVGQAYAFTIPLTGAVGAVTKTSGALPPGLTLGADGAVTGTPTAVGNYTFSVSATGSQAAARVTIAVQQPATISGAAPDGQTSLQYGWSPMVSANATVSLADGTLPPGIKLVNNRLSGVPTTPGSYTFTLAATNGYGTPATLTSRIMIRQAAAIVANPAPSGNVGIGYAYSVTLSGNPVPTATVTAGKLPDGLTLSPSGAITGTPTKNGTFSFTITASNGATTIATKQLSIFISPSPVITGTPPVGIVGAAYNYAFTVGGSPTLTVSKSMGTLPPGLTLNADGTLTGAPTDAGTFTFTAVATNQYGSAALTVSLNVGTAPTIVADAPTGIVGVGYNHTFASTGSGTITATGLPDGLVLSPSGALTGNPTAAGTWSIAVTATNTYGTTTKTEDLVIDPATTGQARVVAPPASVQSGASEDANIRVFGERANISLSSDLTIGGTTIPAGTKINCYYVHADALGADNVAHLMSGSVSFGSQVLAVAATAADLQSTAVLFGNPGVTYSTSADQGLEYDDRATAGTSVGTLDVAFNVYNTSDDVRVITLAH